MSASHTILDNLPSLCQKLWDLVEVWRSYNKNNFACFFETRCRITENAEIVTFWPYCSLMENITIMFELSTTLSYRKLLFTLACATSWCSLNQNVGRLSYCRSLKTGDSLWSIHTDAQKSHLLLHMLTNEMSRVVCFRTPFTIQRICELVTNPTKHYKKADKFMRGIEKVTNAMLNQSQ